jgi:hypothetical protein
MKTKVKWVVKEMLARRQRRLLKMWLRHVKILRDEEDMVHVCEPKDRRNLSDEDELRSLEDIRYCQEGRMEISNCQVGNEMRSLQVLIDCQEDNREMSCCQEGNEMGSEDLIGYQEGNIKFSIFQVGEGTKVRLSKSFMNSKVSSNQQGKLIEEDWKSIFMIGEIHIFLPLSPVEARVCVADATIGERQPVVTIKEME